MKTILHLIIWIPILTAPVWAGEYAVLHTGFRLQADRHEIDGDRVRLFSNGGVTEMPVGAVAHFEPDERPEPAPPVVPLLVAPQLPAPVAPAVPSSARELASNAARKFSLPESFVQSVMKAESGFQAAALSPKGAIGLMQLMPGTAKTLGVDPMDPQQNAEGGARYLRDLLAKYESNPDQVLLALAAYNAGPAAVERYHGVPPYRETREYIVRVLKSWDRQSAVGSAVR